MVDYKNLKIGCQIHSLDEWGKRYKAIARANNAEDIIDEYMLYYNVAVARYGAKRAPREGGASTGHKND